MKVMYLPTQKVLTVLTLDCLVIQPTVLVMAMYVKLHYTIIIMLMFMLSQHIILLILCCRMSYVLHLDQEKTCLTVLELLERNSTL